ncbi:hypothetical protein [Sphingomonas sp. CCH5-D11]|uniref:hypothetical protein n=1 Tax=Sphingomonas sp. CCH5-D11 TaxID=1768786 RepID=UPI0008332F48|nr:hypothetical protein [Sphingomonas sp. CCH5-D11]
MAKAHFRRDVADDQIVYSISPAALLGWRSFSLFGIGFSALLVGGALWVGLWIFHYDLGWTGYYVLVGLVGFLMYRRSARGYGSRSTSLVTIGDGDVSIKRGLRSVVVPRAAIRRLRYFNTASDMAPVAYDYSAAHAQLAAESHAAVEKHCWGVQLDHGNQTDTVVDGLDVVTAQNLLEDLSRDLFKSRASI